MDIDDTKWYLIRDPKTGKVWTANGKAGWQTQVTLEEQLDTEGDEDSVIPAQQWAFVDTRQLPGSSQEFSGIQSRLTQNTVVTYGDQDAATHENTPITSPGKPLRMFYDVVAPSAFWTTAELGMDSQFPFTVSTARNLWIKTDGTDLTMEEAARDANGKPTSDPQDWVDQGYTWELVELGSIQS